MLSPDATPQQRWNELDADRQSFITRCEAYAAYTKPKLCLPPGYNQQQVEKQHDYQSVGAQACNHVSNKLMLALFAPSRPFFRLDPGVTAQAELANLGSPADIAAILSQGERTAIKVLDQRGVRPKLYELTQHLLVTGNALVNTKGKNPRIMGIKKYCVKRAADGTLVELVIREAMAYGTLAKNARDELSAAGKASTDPKATVCLYTHVYMCDTDAGKTVYKECQAVEDFKLSDKFGSQYKPEELPYVAATWDLADGDDYGTGLVEDYRGDFAALSMLSESVVYAAILKSQFRWLVKPGAQTKIEDVNESKNGDAIPGESGDVTPLTSDSAADLAGMIALAESYINRIGRGFMLASAVTRNAERVTAEEIRATADELETSFGGAYSRIATDVQPRLAMWCLKESGQDIANKDFKPTIVTGMDALSRAGDRENLVLFLQDCSAIGNLSPQIQDRLKVGAVIAQFAAARGLGATEYLLGEAEYNQLQQQRQQQALMQQQAMIDSKANADASVAAVKQGAK